MQKKEVLKVVLINGGALKNRVLGRVLSALLPHTRFAADVGFEIEYQIVEVPSASEGVHIISKEDCLSLMRAKINEARIENPDASYYIFMRGRFDDIPATENAAKMMEECALVLVQNNGGANGKIIEAYSQAASFEVPEEIADLVRAGVSFSKAVETVTKTEGVKEGSGFVGILTKNSVTKEEQYFQPLAIAFSSCLYKEQV